MSASEPDRARPQASAQGAPAEADAGAGSDQRGVAAAAPERPGAAEDRGPAHEIDPVPPECPAGCTPIAVVPDKTIKDDTWVFLPPGTGLKGRVLFTPVRKGVGRPLVARTAVHDKVDTKGAFAHPGLTLRLGRDAERRVW